MTRIDFYISDRPGERELIACRLCEKAYRHGLSITIHCPDAVRLQRLDDLLWTFRQGSFLPHERHRGDNDDVPILLTEGEGPVRDVLINLSDAPEPPPNFASHLRLLEIIDGEEGVRTPARSRYKAYEQQGYPLQTHTL